VEREALEAAIRRATPFSVSSWMMGSSLPFRKCLPRQRDQL